MKTPSLALLVLVGGCATAQPLMSDAERKGFEDVVHEAEAAGASSEPPSAVECLREAKSEFDYAQRLPGDREHARRVLAEAQRDAALALALARRHLQDNADARATARREEKATEEAMSATTGASGP